MDVSARDRHDGDYVLQYCLDVEVHRSAHKHGITTQLLELIWLKLKDINLVIHAMPLRAQFYNLLPQSPEDMP